MRGSRAAAPKGTKSCRTQGDFRSSCLKMLMRCLSQLIEGFQEFEGFSKANMRPERPVLRPDWPVLRPDWPDLRPARPDLRGRISGLRGHIEGLRGLI